jgi:hypothetical protein
VRGKNLDLGTQLQARTRLSSAVGQETSVRPQRTMDCLFVRTQFTIRLMSGKRIVNIRFDKILKGQ